MKFQILTYQRLVGTTKVVDPFVAIAIGVPPLIQSNTFYGATPEEALEKCRTSVQKYMDEVYTNLIITEVEVAPATVDRFGKPI